MKKSQKQNHRNARRKKKRREERRDITILDEQVRIARIEDDTWDGNVYKDETNKNIASQQTSLQWIFKKLHIF